MTGIASPVVNTSVTFRFGSVSADASAAGNSDYAGAGYGSYAAANEGLPFVPTVYTATERSWSFPYHISLYQYSSTTQPLFDTEVANTSDATYMYQAGDLVEMYNNTPVYDVTTGVPLGPSTGSLAMYYVPMIVTPDSAKINFDMPALPNAVEPVQSLLADPRRVLHGPRTTVGRPGPAELTTTFPNTPLAAASPMPTSSPAVCASTGRMRRPARTRGCPRCTPRRSPAARSGRTSSR